ARALAAKRNARRVTNEVTSCRWDIHDLQCKKTAELGPILRLPRGPVKRFSGLTSLSRPTSIGRRRMPKGARAGIIRAG
ncbi:MAG: hypothetical protein ACRD1S_03955, partial [Vicinamibacterales bacterium]